MQKALVTINRNAGARKGLLHEYHCLEQNATFLPLPLPRPPLPLPLLPVPLPLPPAAFFGTPSSMGAGDSCFIASSCSPFRAAAAAGTGLEALAFFTLLSAGLALSSLPSLACRQKGFTFSTSTCKIWNNVAERHLFLTNRDKLQVQKCSFGQLEN